jgi:hypothetical protein
MSTGSEAVEGYERPKPKGRWILALLVVLAATLTALFPPDPISGYKAHAASLGNSTASGSCNYNQGGGHYGNINCGTVYVYVKGTNGVWYIATTVNSGGNAFYNANYDQPNSSGNNFYVYATGARSGCSGTSQQWHGYPGWNPQFASIYNMVPCI